MKHFVQYLYVPFCTNIKILDLKNVFFTNRQHTIENR